MIGMSDRVSASLFSITRRVTSASFCDASPVVLSEHPKIVRIVIINKAVFLYIVYCTFFAVESVACCFFMFVVVSIERSKRQRFHLIKNF